MNRFDTLVGVLCNTFPDIPVYDEKIPQHFRQPCFSIRLVSEQRTPMTSTLQEEYTVFDIRYFPSAGIPQREKCRAVAERLKYELEAICEERSYLLDMSYTIVDDVLHFTLDIDGYETVERNTDVDPMENLTVTVDTGKSTMESNDENMGKFTFEIKKEV